MNILTLLEKHATSLREGNCVPFEEELSAHTSSLEDAVIGELARHLQTLPLYVREQIKATLFDAHLEQFPYKKERISEYARIDRMYVEALHENSEQS